MATDAKCVQIDFEVCELTALTNMSAHAIPPNHFRIGHSGKHVVISDELCLHFFEMHIMMPNVVKITMAMKLIALMDFTLPSC